jgi:hypothetical protein
MEWEQLLGFYQVAKLGSLSKASAATLRKQSVLSQQVKSLEKELDCRLLERIGKREMWRCPLFWTKLSEKIRLFWRCPLFWTKLSEKIRLFSAYGSWYIQPAHA